MSVDYVDPEGVHKPAGPYSHLALTEPGRLVFVSGQVSVDPVGEIVGVDDLGAQFRQVFANLVANLAAAGAAPTDVVELKTYLVGSDNLPELREVRQGVFAEHYGDGPYPPSTLLIVSGLADPRLLVEVSAIARIPDSD